MFSVALLSLILPLAAPLPATPVQAAATRASAADPSIRVTLDRSDYVAGDQARVTVSVRDDGYLLVLRLSPDGYMRVLFPVDPGDDNFVRGNGSYEIRGRGDRDAFTVSSQSGTGTVYAAWSTEPFRFDGYVLGDHWDYRVLDGTQMSGDAEAALTQLAQNMSTGHFDYDLTSYSVARQVASSGTTHYVTMYPYPVYPSPVVCDFSAWCGGGSYFNVSIGFGWGRIRSAWYDPYYYDPFYWNRPYYRYYPTYYGCYYCGYRYPRVVVINRPVQRGYYPYQWKPGQRGGGGSPGVQYRPRAVAYASAVNRPVSPLFEASKYRRAATTERVAATPRRHPTTTVFGAPISSGSSIGTARRGLSSSNEPSRSGVGSARATPRRAPGSAAGTNDLRGGSATRVGPRTTDDARSGSAVGQRRTVAAPRSAQPSSAQPQRSAPNTVRVEPRAEPRRVEVRSAPRAEPRSAPRAEPRSAPRAAPTRSAPAPRASAPRSAPAPRVSQPRAAQPRSAPAPRARRP